MEVDNVICFGDGGDTYFILFDTGDSTKRLIINNSIIKNSISNGPFIKFIGEGSVFTSENMIIDSVRTYGPIIDTESKKSNTTFTNLEFKSNYNNNKYTCGNLYFSNKIEISINNSIFENNLSQSDGGTLCLNTFSNIKFNLNSNNFTQNTARNGGALYIKERNQSHNINTANDKDDNDSIIIKNNIFYKNKAINFGGAIYSDYPGLGIATTQNNKFESNEAGIDGGGFFSKNYVNSSLLNSIFSHNQVNYIENDYASVPSYITMNFPRKNNSINITPGEFFPLSFVLYNEFNKPVQDSSLYYSSMLLKVNLIKINDKNGTIANSQNDFILTGNVGSFINGKCELNNFRIFAKTGAYYLNVELENNVEKVNTQIEKVIINVTECHDNQILIYKNKNKDIISCEKPICRKDCPITTTASCEIPSRNVTANNVNENICVCIIGWTGKNCQEKINVDF
ncbi:hypothetical protein PIROE2DRAFT_14060, partial [Piromyces sp. E2]